MGTKMADRHKVSTSTWARDRESRGQRPPGELGEPKAPLHFAHSYYLGQQIKQGYIMYTIISNVHKLIKIFRWNPSNCIVKCLKISTKLFENIEKKRWKKSRKFVYIMCRSPFNLTIFFTKLGFYLKLVGRTNHVISRICFKNPKSNSNSGKLLVDHCFSLFYFSNTLIFFKQCGFLSCFRNDPNLYVCPQRKSGENAWKSRASVGVSKSSSSLRTHLWS